MEKQKTITLINRIKKNALAINNEKLNWYKVEELKSQVEKDYNDLINIINGL